MDRRDFIKNTGIVGVALGIPSVLTRPTEGEGWLEYYVCDFIDSPISTLEHHENVVQAFKRAMKEDNLTEIRGYKVELNYDPRRHMWIHTHCVQVR